MQHFCIDCIPFDSKRMIHWCHLFRVYLSPILTHERYCWSCSSGSEGSAIHEACKHRINLGSSRCTSQLKGAAKAPFGLPQNVIYCSSVSSAMIYSILHLWTKHTPAIIQAGPFALQQRQPSDCGHQAAWPRGLALLCFHWPMFLLPPSEPKTSVLPTPPPFPASFSLTLFTHIQIKKWAPSSLFY